MIIYGTTLSPFVRKAVAFAVEKGVEFQVKGVGLGSKDPDFLEASPFGKIPALRDGDYLLSDSTAICLYLDALHPEPPLIPTEPKARGLTISWDEFADTILVGAAAPVFFNRVVAPRFLGQEGDNTIAETHAAKLPALFDHLERSIPQSGWLVEDRLTLADLAVASSFANMRYAAVSPDAATYPRLTAYVEKLFARPSFADSLAREAKMFGG